MFERLPLADLADLAMGETIIAEDCDGHGLPIFSAATNDAAWNYSTRFRRKLSRGTIVVGARGSIGFPRMPGDELFGATQTTITVSAREGAVVPRYLFHVLRSIDFKALTSQQAIPMLTVAEFGAVRLPRPPVAEQAKVAEVLDTLDTTIRQTEAIIEKLRQLKQGLLHDLLTRGIDANGELRPAREDAPQHYQESPLGWIPSTWRCLPLGEFADVKAGATPARGSSQRYFAGGTIPWVKTLDLNEDSISDTDEFITPEALRETSCSLLPAGAILVAMYGGWEQIGRTGLLSRPAATNQAISGLVLRSDLDRPEYVLRALQHGRSRWQRVAASTRKDPNITRGDVLAFHIPMPDPAEQAEIAKRVRSILECVCSEAAELSKLKHLKSGLMDDLLTGRVRVTPLLDAANA